MQIKNLEKKAIFSDVGKILPGETGECDEDLFDTMIDRFHIKPIGVVLVPESDIDGLTDDNSNQNY